MTESDPSDHALTATGGWCLPSSIRPDLTDGIVLEIPEIEMPRTPRGGIKYGEARIPDSAKPNPPRLTYTTGHWEYGVDTADYEGGDTEPDIVTGESIGWYEHEPFSSLEEAAAFHPGGKLYKRWRPAVGPWDEVKP